MLLAASTSPSATPYAASPATKTAYVGRGDQHRHRDRDDEEPAAQHRGAVRALRQHLGDHRAGTGEQHHHQQQQGQADSLRSQLSWSVGSRVVRLMNSRPWAAKAGGDGRPRAHRRRVRDDVVMGASMARAGRVRVCRDERGGAGTLAGPARRDRVEPRRPAHLDHRPAAHRRSGSGSPRELAGPPRPRRLRPGAHQSRGSGPARPPRLAGFPEPEVDADLAEWDYGDYEGITTAEIRETVPGWTIWSHPTPGGETADAGRRPGSTGWSPGSRDQPRAHPGLRARPRPAGAHRPLARPAGRRRRLFRLDTATVSVLGFERGQPVILRWNA